MPSNSENNNLGDFQEYLGSANAGEQPSVGNIKAPFFFSNTLTETTHVDGGKVDISINVDNVEKYGYDYLLKLNGQMEMRIAYNAGDPYEEEEDERTYIPTSGGFRLTKCQPTANMKRVADLSKPEEGKLYNLTGGIQIESYPGVGTISNLPLLYKDENQLDLDGRMESYLQDSNDMMTEQLRGSKYNRIVRDDTETADTNDNEDDIMFSHFDSTGIHGDRVYYELMREGEKLSYNEAERNRNGDHWVNELGRTVAGNQIAVFYKREEVKFLQDSVGITIIDESEHKTKTTYNDSGGRKCVHGLIYGQKKNEDSYKTSENVSTLASNPDSPATDSTVAFGGLDEDVFRSAAPRVIDLIFNSETGGLSYDAHKDKHNILTEFINNNNNGTESLELKVRDRFRIGNDNHLFVDQNTGDGATLVRNLANVLFYIFVDSVDPNGKIVNANKDTEQIAYDLITDIEEQMIESIHKDVDFWLALTNQSEHLRPNLTEDYFENEKDARRYDGIYHHIRRVSNANTYSQKSTILDSVVLMPSLYGYQSTNFTHSCELLTDSTGIPINLRRLSALPEHLRPQGNFTFLTRTNKQGKLTDFTSVSVESYEKYENDYKGGRTPTDRYDVVIPLFPSSDRSLPFYETGSGNSNMMDSNNNRYCRVGDVFRVYHTADGKASGPEGAKSGKYFDIVVISVDRHDRYGRVPHRNHANRTTIQPGQINPDNQDEYLLKPFNNGWGPADYENVGTNDAPVYQLKNGLIDRYGNTLCGFPNKIAILDENNSIHTNVPKSGRRTPEDIEILQSLGFSISEIRELLRSSAPESSGNKAFVIDPNSIDADGSNRILNGKINGDDVVQSEHIGLLLYNGNITKQVPYGPHDNIEITAVNADNSNTSVHNYNYNNDNIIPDYDLEFNSTGNNDNWGPDQHNDIVQGGSGGSSLSKNGVFIVALESKMKQATVGEAEAMDYLKVRENFTRLQNNNPKNLQTHNFLEGSPIYGDARHVGNEMYNLQDASKIPNDIENTNLRSLGSGKALPTDTEIFQDNKVNYLHTHALMKIYIDEEGKEIKELQLEYEDKMAEKRLSEDSRRHITKMNDEEKTTFIHIPDLNTGLFLTGHENQLVNEDNYSAEMYLTGDHFICPFTGLKLSVESQDRPVVDTTIEVDGGEAIYGEHFTFASLNKNNKSCEDSDSCDESTLTNNHILIDLYLTSKLEVINEDLDVTNSTIETYKMNTSIQHHSDSTSLTNVGKADSKLTYNQFTQGVHMGNGSKVEGNPFDIMATTVNQEFIPHQSIERLTYIELDVQLEDIANHLDMKTARGIGTLEYQLSEQIRPTGDFTQVNYVEPAMNSTGISGTRLESLNIQTSKTLNYIPLETTTREKWLNVNDDELLGKGSDYIVGELYVEVPLESIAKQYGDLKEFN